MALSTILSIVGRHLPHPPQPVPPRNVPSDDYDGLVRPVVGNPAEKQPARKERDLERLDVDIMGVSKPSEVQPDE